MKFSQTAVVSFLASLALAADHVPVTIENFDPDFDIKCNGVKVAGRDIYNAVAWGMSLNENDEQLSSSDGNPYPSYYGNSEGFTWMSDECGQNPSDARQHIPVVKGGYFEEGGAAGKYRSVYWYNYDEDIEGHPKGYYCGTIYHKSDNSFGGCDVA